MHSTSVRLQSVFSFFTSVAFALGILTSITTLFYTPRPTADVRVISAKVVSGRPNYYSSKKQDYAFVTFDLDADVESLYHWNTKQVFCWLSVVYGGGGGRGKHTDNEAIIWDAILPSIKTSRLSLRNERVKYNINDISGKFGERNATLRFGWNVQPHVGALTWGSVEAPVAEVMEKSEEEELVGEKDGWRFRFPPVGTRKN